MAATLAKGANLLARRAIVGWPRSAPESPAGRALLHLRPDFRLVCSRLNQIADQTIVGVAIGEVEPGDLERVGDEPAGQPPSCPHRTCPSHARSGPAEYTHPDRGFWMLPHAVADAKIQAQAAGRDLTEGQVSQAS